MLWPCRWKHYFWQYRLFYFTPRHLHKVSIAVLVEGDHLFDLAIFKIDTGPVVTCVAGFVFATFYFGPIKWLSFAFPVIVGTVASINEP